MGDINPDYSDSESVVEDYHMEENNEHEEEDINFPDYNDPESGIENYSMEENNEHEELHVEQEDINLLDYNDPESGIENRGESPVLARPDGVLPPIRLGVVLGQSSSEQHLRLWSRDEQADHEAQTQEWAMQVQERDEVIAALKEKIIQQTGNAISSSEDLSAGRTNKVERSAKQQDPPIFTGDKPASGEKAVKFDHWHMLLKHKLRVNADHFDSDEGKISYILARVGGSVAENLMPFVTDEQRHYLGR
ncbi:hypothetical protein F5Y00DRAFT_259105 [Daldinia vernicosa]|uniref:uncharacterized protein n=1 Tax=Daldinia vernicosa TaxID=114800 RepID=UPI0020085F1A|nr:uncharacterized protein F5Y00DRAFT_259105 [Daldinia vernicosa]KAI0852147.1 hypothetical protein F5Y00DRAFT_259105 [Daldinia vernicosa]